MSTSPAPLTPEQQRILDKLMESAWAPPKPTRAWRADRSPAELYCFAQTLPHRHGITFLPRSIIGVGASREEALNDLRLKITAALVDHHAP